MKSQAHQIAELNLAELEVKMARIDLKESQLSLQRTMTDSLPHERYFTKVIRHPNGERWICVAFNHDAGDLFTNRPFGEGDSPREACQDFDRNWNGEGFDEDGDSHA